MRVVATILTAFLTLLLLASAYLGLTGGIPLLREVHSVARALATGTELLYGVVALVALIGLAGRYAWTLRALVVWAGAVTATGGLAPVVWANTPVMTGVASGAGVGVVLALLVWGWRYAQARSSARAPVAGRTGAGAGASS